MKVSSRMLDAARAEAQVADAELLRRIRDMIVERQRDAGATLEEMVTWQGLRDVLLMATGDVERVTAPAERDDVAWWVELARAMDDAELVSNQRALSPKEAAAAMLAVARSVRQIGRRLGEVGGGGPHEVLEPHVEHAVGLRMSRMEDDLRESIALLAEQVRNGDFRSRLQEWHPSLGISRAEFARRTFADDRTLTPAEYGRLIEVADQEDVAAMLDAERAEL